MISSENNNYSRLSCRAPQPSVHTNAHGRKPQTANRILAHHGRGRLRHRHRGGIAARPSSAPSPSAPPPQSPSSSASPRSPPRPASLRRPQGRQLEAQGRRSPARPAFLGSHPQWGSDDQVLCLPHRGPHCQRQGAPLPPHRAGAPARSSLAVARIPPRQPGARVDDGMRDLIEELCTP